MDKLFQYYKMRNEQVNKEIHYQYFGDEIFITEINSYQNDITMFKYQLGLTIIFWNR